MKNSHKYIYMLGVVSIAMTGCSTKKQTLIVPTGTPSLGAATFLKENKNKIEANIVAGAEQLGPAFASKSYDIIIAPVTLGAKMYNANQNYICYKTVVWGNFYFASTKEITSLSDLAGKSITFFGENTTPSIIASAVLKSNNLFDSVEITYVNDVSTANEYLMNNDINCDYILTAEPSLSILKSKNTIYSIDLQEEWNKITSVGSYPQAAIFANKDLLDDEKYVKTLDSLVASYQNATEEKKTDVATAAIEIDPNFSSFKPNLLANALPNCHFGINEDEKEAMEFYFNKLIEMNYGAQIGAKLPDEGFYH